MALSLGSLLLRDLSLHRLAAGARSHSSLGVMCRCSSARCLRGNLPLRKSHASTRPTDGIVGQWILLMHALAPGRLHLLRVAAGRTIREQSAIAAARFGRYFAARNTCLSVVVFSFGGKSLSIGCPVNLWKPLDRGAFGGENQYNVPIIGIWHTCASRKSVRISGRFLCRRAYIVAPFTVDIHT